MSHKIEAGLGIAALMGSEILTACSGGQREVQVVTATPEPPTQTPIVEYQIVTVTAEATPEYPIATAGYPGGPENLDVYQNPNTSANRPYTVATGAEVRLIGQLADQGFADGRGSSGHPRRQG